MDNWEDGFAIENEDISLLNNAVYFIDEENETETLLEVTDAIDMIEDGLRLDDYLIPALLKSGSSEDATVQIGKVRIGKDGDVFNAYIVLKNGKLSVVARREVNGITDERTIAVISKPEYGKRIRVHSF
jgi:hypothetical protein